MAYFKSEIDRAKADVVVIDPLYQAIDDQQASMILNGQQLADLCNYVLDSGATPICCDHAKRSSENVKMREPLELHDISGAGKAEYFRQWLLVSRREKFAPEENLKPHKLWLSIGGSEGHSSQWALDVNERFNDVGQLDIDVGLTPRHEVVLRQKESTDSRKDTAKQKKFEEQLCKVLTFFKAKDEPRTKTDIRSHMMCSGDAASAYIHHLIEREDIALSLEKVLRGNQKTEGWILIKSMSQQGGQGG